MYLISDGSAASLHRFVFNSMRKGAEVRSDGWNGYKGAETLEYKHVVANGNAIGDPANVVMPRFHRVASLLDRWLLGIHQGTIRRSHLCYYLDEFTFRFARRPFRARGLILHRLMEQAIQ
jgi:hypothetical protein